MKLICYLALTYTQSRTHTKKGHLRSAKKFGVSAVILDVCALIMAFVLAVWATTVVLLAVSVTTTYYPY